MESWIWLSPFLSFHSEVDNVPPTRTMRPLVRYSERRIWFSLLLRTLTHVVTAFPCEKSSTAMSKAINEPCVPSITWQSFPMRPIVWMYSIIWKCFAARWLVLPLPVTLFFSSLWSDPFCRTALGFYGAWQGCRYSPFDVFLKQNTLARQGRFSFKMHFKTEESGATAYIRTW